MAGAPIPPVEPPALPSATAPKPPTIAVVRPPTPAAPTTKAAPPAPPPAASQPQPAPKPMTRKAALTGTQLNVRHRARRRSRAAGQRRDQPAEPARHGLRQHASATAARFRSPSARTDISTRRTTPIARSLATLDVVARRRHAGHQARRQLDRRHHAGQDRAPGLRFGIARPVGNLLNDLRRTTARNAGFGLLFIAIALVGMVPLSGRLTRNLTTLTDGVGRIAQGDYTRARAGEVDATRSAGWRRRSISMAADVEQHQRSAVEQERIRRELELGRRIQSEMLPRAPLHFGLTEVKGVSVPAREVGGDFFNYFALDSGLVALLVGDVSGKGVGAALLMANIQASLRTRFALGQGLSAIAEAIDRDIEANSPGPGLRDALHRDLRSGDAADALRQRRAQSAVRPPRRRPAREDVVHRHAGRHARRARLPRRRSPARAGRPAVLLYRRLRRDGERGRRDVRLRSPRVARRRVRRAAAPSEVLATVEQAIATFRGGRDLFDDATMMAVTVG